MSFQIEVLPYKDESFISWFTRTAFENGTDPKSFALSICVSFPKYWTK